MGGYAFTSAKVTSGAAGRDHGHASSVTDAWVVRPNVGVTYALTRRLALIGSVGYVYTNPTIGIAVSQRRAAASRASSASFRSDYVSITVGTAFSIF